MNNHKTPDHVTLAQCVAILEARRQLVCDQIHDYTTPVAACDVDFNTLLTERAEILLALSHLQPLCRGEAHIAHPREEH